MPPEPIVWGGFTKVELDAAYNNMAAVPDSASRLADWTMRSKATRARPGAELDIPYGPRPRNRIDLFPSGRSNAPLLVFIHGGYWQRNAKEMFACMAEGPLALGLDVALIGYTLAPEASLTEIAAEIRAALDRLALRGQRIVVSGWSAGGHLAALALEHEAVSAALAISGVFDLEPLRASYLDEKLQLSDEELASLSPIRRAFRRKPLVCAFGEAELPELQRQSRAYVSAALGGGTPASQMPLAGHDHFSILEDLASPAGRLARAARDLAGA